MNHVCSKCDFWQTEVFVILLLFFCEIKFEKMGKNWVEWKQPTWDEIEKVNNLLKNTRLMSFAIQDSPNHVTVN